MEGGIVSYTAMRNYEHFKVGGEILIPDHKSAKAGWGLEHPEYLEQKDKDFLREGKDGNKHVFQLTPPHAGKVVSELEQADGGYTEMGVPEQNIIWKRG